ncbi:type VI secretion system tip protein TssI/VgrG, partial [Citrobacter portucalensis]
KSRSPAIWPGRRIQLTEHPQAGLNREWQVVSSDLQGKQPQAVAGRSGSGTTLENDFTVMPADRTWRPRPMEKPSVDGPQSATVTGPEGEEIFCDEHGRVRVKFNWDRYNPANQDSSCWIRVVQAWAGPGFGNLAIPRVGQEVIVDFLNGDPDQPIIMGRTYHADNPPPGGLPGTKTQMTIRSKTYKGSGYNELMFEDKTGQELLSMHAQKDMKTTVLNDQGTAIIRNQSLVVGNNRLKVVTANEDVKIDGHQLLNIRQFQEVNVKTDVTCFNGGDRIMQSAGNVVIGSGSMIRLECGESALELHAGGVINLKGKAFNIVAEGNSLITTGTAMLGLNPEEPAPAIGVVGKNHKKDLTSIIQGLFPEETGGGK